MSVNVPPGYYDQGTRRGHVNAGQVVVGTTQVIVLRNTETRLGVVICNNGAATAYLAGSPMTAYTDGHALPPGATLSLSTSAGLVAMTQTGTTTLTYLEETTR